ncbi:hypothetical protein [Singulisphaera sp. GP187]|uniref:hypothetical protein n=1 Tax=Singulisphaera sp. GP187 TaxID=1882752 RepID=UPI00116143EE|nr:hypothetical protein [Singulisphaera sp. GP187]
MEPTSPVLMIRNRGHLVVELLISKHRTYTVSFTSSPASKSTLSDHVSKFACIAASQIADDRRAGFVPYLKSLMTDKLLHSHGTLLAVVDSSSTLKSHDHTLDAGTWLSPVVDLAARYSRAITERTAIALAELQASEVLLEGMVNSDGVVVFGADGTLRAFRVFLKPDDAEKKALAEKGGGRRRTYELMRNRTNVTLMAALFRSQDGDTECAGGES